MKSAALSAVLAGLAGRALAQTQQTYYVKVNMSTPVGTYYLVRIIQRNCANFPLVHQGKTESNLCSQQPIAAYIMVLLCVLVELSWVPTQRSSMGR